MTNSIRLKFLLLLFCAAGTAHAVELFAKGSASRTMHAKDEWTINVRASGGLAFQIASGVRLEARYTNISALQNKIDVSDGGVSGTITDILTQTEVYTAGLSIDLFSGRRARFKPYLVLGAGYAITKRSYEFALTGSSTKSLLEDPEARGLSANGGLGVQWQIGRNFAIDFEVVAYVTNFEDPDPLYNLYGSLGVRMIL